MLRDRRAKSEEPRPQRPSYYQWQAPGRPAPIHLSLDVVARLGTDVTKAFWSVPKRGAEIGGILIGSSGEDGAVHIDDYEPVPCEYRRGPSYMLSEADRRRMERALRRLEGRRQVVGFYRSHTRLGLYLDEQDYSLIQSYFSGPHHVFLLVRPQHDGTGVAGFFFWEDGHIHRHSTYREFPFDRTELLPAAERAAATAAVELPVPVASALAAAVPAPAAPKPAAAARRGTEGTASPGRKRRQRTLSVRWGIAALVLVSFGLLEYAVLELVNGSRDTAALAASAPALRVERNGGYLQVSWNHNAPAVARARRGVLSITDGLSHQKLALSPEQLRTGGVAYFASTNDVSFRLQLYGATEATESLRVVTGPAPARKEAAQSPVSRPAAARRIGPVSAPQRPAQAKRPRPRRYFYDDGL